MGGALGGTNAPSESRDVAGACSDGKFVVPRLGEAYDAQAIYPNRNFWLR